MANLTAENLTTAWTGEHLSGLSNKKNCSGFVYTLLEASGINIPSGLNADRMIDYFTSNPLFSSLGEGEDGLKEAVKFANRGKIVIVGVKSYDYGQSNGHVAIVMKGGNENAKRVNPFIYGGSKGVAASQGEKKLSNVFGERKWKFLKFFVVL